MTKLFFITLAVVLQLGTVCAAALTPTTDENRAPMAALILLAGLAVPSGLLVASQRVEG